MGAMSPAPAPAASIHTIWRRGAGGAPSPSSSGRWDNPPSHLPAQVLGLMAVMRGQPLDWGWGGVWNMQLCTRSLGGKEKVERKKTQLGLLKIELC